MPRRIELRTPNFVHPLMLAPPEGYGRPKTHVEVMEVLKSVHQSFGIELRPVSFQRFHLELLHGFGGPSGLVAVVNRDKPKLIIARRRPGTAGS
jgi:hypothetical protein